MISSIETDIRTQLLAQISYLAAAVGGTVRGVVDARTAMDLTVIPPPAVLIENAGEEAEDPWKVGNADQISVISWDLFCIAQSFSVDGARTGTTTKPGVYTMIDDVIAALQGFLLPSCASSQPSRLRFVGHSRFALADSRVIYVTRWTHKVLRDGL